MSGHESIIERGTTARLSPAFAEAVQYATTLHADQLRKGTDTPYIAHPFAVAAMVLAHGGSETQAIGALLHDAIEDHPRSGRTRAEIHERFGPDVLAIVEACTDADAHPKPPWRERKERYLAHLAALPAEARLVALADKVHNASAILFDLRINGERVWDRFNAGKSGSLWYYRALADTFTETDDGPLAHELERIVSEVEVAAITSERFGETARGASRSSRS